MLVSTRNETETVDGYLGPLYQNGTDIYFTDKLLMNAKKFVIGLWLGTTSLTFALIIHVGRCSKKAANAINKVLFDVMQITEKVVTMPKKFAQFTKTATKKEAAGETSKETLLTNEKQTSEKSGIIVQMETLVNNTEDDKKSDLEQERIPLKTDEQKITKQLDHVFALFAEQIQRISTTSIILVLFFLGFNIYALVINGKLSYDWIILSPFPFWFLLTLVTNFIAFPITETILLHRKMRKKQSPDHNRQLHNRPILKKMLKSLADFIVVISSTTLPVFVIFHFFLVGCSFFNTNHSNYLCVSILHTHDYIHHLVIYYYKQHIKKMEGSNEQRIKQWKQGYMEESRGIFQIFSISTHPVPLLTILGPLPGNSFLFLKLSSQHCQNRQP